MVNTSLYQVTG